MTASLVVFAVGEWLSKLWSLRPGMGLLLAVVATYGLCGALWLPALASQRTLSALGTMWSCLGCMIPAVLGVVVFGESLTLTRMIGLSLGVVAVWCLA